MTSVDKNACLDIEAEESDGNSHPSQSEDSTHSGKSSGVPVGLSPAAVPLTPPAKEKQTHFHTLNDIPIGLQRCNFRGQPHLSKGTATGRINFMLDQHTTVQVRVSSSIHNDLTSGKLDGKLLEICGATVRAKHPADRTSCKVALELTAGTTIRRLSTPSRPFVPLFRPYDLLEALLQKDKAVVNLQFVVDTAERVTINKERVVLQIRDPSYPHRDTPVKLNMWLGRNYQVDKTAASLEGSSITPQTHIFTAEMVKVSQSPEYGVSLSTTDDTIMLPVTKFNEPIFSDLSDLLIQDSASYSGVISVTPEGCIDPVCQGRCDDCGSSATNWDWENVKGVCHACGSQDVRLGMKVQLQICQGEGNVSIVADGEIAGAIMDPLLHGDEPQHVKWLGNPLKRRTELKRFRTQGTITTINSNITSFALDASVAPAAAQ